MDLMRTRIRKLGNSQAVLIPMPYLTQLALEDEIEMDIAGDTIVLRKPRGPVRDGWEEMSKAVAESGEDELVLGEFGNAGDEDLEW